MKIHKGDKVIVISGKDKGKQGEVLQAIPASEKVIVDGVNVAVHHEKARRRGSVGQIVKKPAPIHVSNVALLDGKKPARVGYDVVDGKKTRVTRPNGTKV